MSDSDATLDRILARIAEQMDCDPADLEPPLGEVVDADALVQVVQSDGVRTVSFEYRGHRIEIDAAERVGVDGPLEA